MLWIIIAVIVFLVGFGRLVFEYLRDKKAYEESVANEIRSWEWRRKPDKGEVVVMSIVWALMVLLGWVLVAMLATGIVCKVNPAYESRFAPIVAVSDDTKTKGPFFLGSGTIDENPVYFYYGYDEYGNVARFWTDAEFTGIRQDGKKTLEIIDPVVTNKWLQVGTFGETRYVFHVPPNSVKQDFNFDNQ